MWRSDFTDPHIFYFSKSTNLKYSFLLQFFLGFTLLGFSQELKPREGFIPVEGGRIWYKIIGNGKGTPLLLIHGGPGSRSCDGIPAYSLLANERPVIFYDQLGSGNSDRPTDTALWQLPRFVDEIEKIREELHLKELHILGSSWGGTVLVEYMVSKKPTGVKSAIFSGPLISTPIWMQDAKLLLTQLPKNIQDTIQKYEDLKKYDAPSYLAATDSFYARFLARKPRPKNKPPECDSTRKFNEQVYNYMWGPTEFNATGTLKNYDRSGQLPQLHLPVLFIAGQYDEARPETMYLFQKAVPNSEVIIIENAGHAKTNDQPLLFTNAIRSFLHTVDSK